MSDGNPYQSPAEQPPKRSGPSAMAIRGWMLIQLAVGLAGGWGLGDVELGFSGLWIALGFGCLGAFCLLLDLAEYMSADEP